MEDLRRIIGRNIVLLRTNAHLTQAEFAEQLHYTDKAVSKWERGDSVPDIAVLKQIADLFGVTVDYLLHEHEESEKVLLAEDVANKRYNHLLITLIAVIGVWFLAVMVFAVVYMALDVLLWQAFVMAVPVSLIVGLVFNSVWGRKKGMNHLLISLLLWSALLTLYLLLLSYNLWALFLLGVPGQICLILSSRIRRSRR